MVDDARRIFQVWAPEGGVWSNWAKPTLFVASGDGLTVPGAAAMGMVSMDRAQQGAAWSKALAPDGKTVVVIDLPNGDSVIAGMVLARLGFAPVPMYNGCPGPGKDTLISNDGICRLLAVYCDELAGLRLGVDAGPSHLNLAFPRF